MKQHNALATSVFERKRRREGVGRGKASATSGQLKSLNPPAGVHRLKRFSLFQRNTNEARQRHGDGGPHARF